jgi:hypothetical protein
MVHDSLAWWQFALRLALILLVVIGLVRFFRRNGGANPARHRRTAALAIGIGVVGLLATKRLTQPSSHPVSESGSKSSGPVQTLVSARSFDSNDQPAVAIEAPEGWRVEFDGSQRLLMVVKGTEPNADAAAVFQVKSASLSDQLDIDKMQRITTNELKRQGWTVGDPFSDNIDGRSAIGFTAAGAEEKKCAWFVKRGAKHVSVLMCVSRDATDPKDACHPVLGRLKWRDAAVD